MMDNGKEDLPQNKMSEYLNYMMMMLIMWHNKHIFFEVSFQYVSAGVQL